MAPRLWCCSPAGSKRRLPPGSCWLGPRSIGSPASPAPGPPPRCRSPARSPPRRAWSTSPLSAARRISGNRLPSGIFPGLHLRRRRRGSPFPARARDLRQERSSKRSSCDREFAMNEMRPARDASREQAQFLRVLSRDEAMARFRQALDPKPLGTEQVRLADALGRVVADHVSAPVDVPPFDRSNVDGFALRAADVSAASDNAPISLAVNDETIACGTEPRLTVNAGTATPIATGGPIPRGADAVVMIEHTDIEDDGLVVRRAVGPAQNISFAGSDMALGEVVLRKGTQ